MSSCEQRNRVETPRVTVTPRAATPGRSPAEKLLLRAAVG